MTLLTILEIWAQNKTSGSFKDLQMELNLPSSTKAALRSYQEEHDPMIEEYFANNYKFSTLTIALHYPKDALQDATTSSVLCPSSKVDPKSWTLTSIRIFLDIKEQYIVGCTQVFKNIWQNVEKSFSFGVTDTRNTATGGLLEIGPGEAITAVQIFRAYVPCINSDFCWDKFNHACSHTNSLRRHDAKYMNRNSAFVPCTQRESSMEPGPGVPFCAVVTRCAFIVNTYACATSHGCSKMGLRRKIFMPPVDKSLRLDLEEMYLNVDANEARNNSLPTVSHLFGLAEVKRTQNNSPGVVEIVPIWAAADDIAMMTLNQAVKGSAYRPTELMRSDRSGARASDKGRPLSFIEGASTLKRSQSLRPIMRSSQPTGPYEVDIDYCQRTELPSNIPMGFQTPQTRIKRSNSWRQPTTTQNTSDLVQFNCYRNNNVSERRMMYENSANASPKSMRSGSDNRKRRVVFSTNHYLNHESDTSPISYRRACQNASATLSRRQPAHTCKCPQCNPSCNMETVI
ncbi:hypothetical protein Ciccas_000666 [Cichlidogyrus casuarinus]|uniref:Uncharacterized protein n=1 Tax=Cichlidogyrus casuarinus TaxID=1844966 RepID=A0ABD2QNE6_9PLAT